MHSVETAAAAAYGVLLADKVTAILAKLGHPRPQDWLVGLQQVHENAMTPTTPVDEQRFLINRYWHLQLGALPPEAFDRHENMDVRFCLVPQGSIDRWLELFEQKVAPCIVRNNLPPAVH